jgi:AAHS family 4-hydroxybenzoate transporter-like MFS transporter
MNGGSVAQVVDVGRLLDEGRASGYQRWLVLLTAMTIVFDGVDNQLLGVVMPTLMQEWSAPRSAFAPVVSLGYLGMMVGGAIAGILGDRVGRKQALLGSMVLFGAMTLAAVLADGPTMLGWLRLLAGIGLGGAMPNAAALAAEFVPLRHRPLAVTVTIVCVPLGGVLAGVLGIRLLPHFGWQTLFVLGGVIPIAAAALLVTLLPESPRFLARHPSRAPELVALLRRMGHPVPVDVRFVDEREPQVSRVSVGTLFDRTWRRDTSALWVAFFSCLLAVYVGFSWLTSLFAGAGFDASTASTAITLFNLGGVAGALAGGVVIGTVGSRAAMLTMAAGGMAGATTLAFMPITASTTIAPVMAMLTFTGACINATQTAMYALAAHVYPSGIRSTGVGAAVSFGRTGAILSGYAGAAMIEWHGSTSYFGFMAAAMALALAALAVVQRHVPARKSADRSAKVSV